MTIRQQLFDDNGFWGDDFPFTRVEVMPVAPPPAAATSVRRKWLSTVAGMALASVFVLPPGASSTPIVCQRENVNFSSARAPGLGVQEQLEPTDLHERAPDLERAGRLIRGLKPVESFDEYV